MKTFIIVILLTALSVVSSNAEEYKGLINLTMTNNFGQSNTGLICGVDEGATNGLDSALGEVDYPGHPLQQFSVYYTFSDSVKYEGDTTWYTEHYFSKKDIRPVQPVNVFTDTFNLDIQWGQSDSITVSWTGVDNPFVQSAVIQDPLGFQYKTDMKTESKFTFFDLFTDKLRVIVTFNKFPSSVAKQAEKNVQIYPNPTSNLVKIQSETKYIFELYDNAGNVIMKGDTRQGALNLEHISAGVYTIVLIDNSGTRLVRRIIKI